MLYSLAQPFCFLLDLAAGPSGSRLLQAVEMRQDRRALSLNESQALAQRIYHQPQTFRLRLKVIPLSDRRPHRQVTRGNILEDPSESV